MRLLKKMIKLLILIFKKECESKTSGNANCCIGRGVCVGEAGVRWGGGGLGAGRTVREAIIAYYLCSE